MSQRFNGTQYARELQNLLAQRRTHYKGGAQLHVFSVGDNSVTRNYLNYKKAFADAIDVSFIEHQFNDTPDQERYFEDTLREVSVLNQPVLIQLPLPPDWNQQKLLDLIPTHLDVDLLSRASKEKFIQGNHTMLAPVLSALLKVIHYININLTDLNIVVIGQGTLVGTPVSIWLDHNSYNYNVITHTTPESEKSVLLARADMIISGVGIPGLVTADQVKEGVILIDAGTSSVAGSLRGDIHPGAYQKASFYTPVPGGIGPLTIASLYENVLQVYENNS